LGMGWVSVGDRLGMGWERVRYGLNTVDTYADDPSQPQASARDTTRSRDLHHPPLVPCQCLIPWIAKELERSKTGNRWRSERFLPRDKLSQKLRASLIELPISIVGTFDPLLSQPGEQATRWKMRGFTEKKKIIRPPCLLRPFRQNAGFERDQRPMRMHALNSSLPTQSA
jgi:hypothetical protein